MNRKALIKMVHCVYEVNGEDRIKVCRESHEATQVLSQIQVAKNGGKLLGYVDQNNDIHSYADQLDAAISRVRKVAEVYILAHMKRHD